MNSYKVNVNLLPSGPVLLRALMAYFPMLNTKLTTARTGYNMIAENQNLRGKK